MAYLVSRGMNYLVLLNPRTVAVAGSPARHDAPMMYNVIHNCLHLSLFYFKDHKQQRISQQLTALEVSSCIEVSSAGQVKCCSSHTSGRVFYSIAIGVNLSHVHPYSLAVESLNKK